MLVCVCKGCFGCFVDPRMPFGDGVEGDSWDDYVRDGMEWSDIRMRCIRLC